VRVSLLTCWTQLVFMLFCQLAHADSLREICEGFHLLPWQTDAPVNRQSAE